MTITITPPAGVSFVGPGADIHWSSDFIGPLTSTALFQGLVFRDSDLTDEIWAQAVHTTAKAGHFQIGTMIPNQLFAYQPLPGNVAIADSTNAFVQVKLFDSVSAFTPVDTGSLAIPWSNILGLGSMVTQLAANPPVTLSGTEDSTLTSIKTDTANLISATTVTLQQLTGAVTTTIGQALSQTTLDKLTLTEATSGPTSSPFRTTITDYFFGVIVRVTTIPPFLQATTPDLNWYYPDLAVLRIIRGVDEIARTPIHVPNKLVWNPPLWGFNWMNDNGLFFPPPEINIAVDWMPGAEGQVFFITLP